MTADDLRSVAAGPADPGPERVEAPPVAIAVRDLRKTYRARWRRRSVEALAGVDLEVSRGEVVGLLGPNGSGKTTLFRLLLGLGRPDGGRALLFGRPAGRRESRRRLGFLPEENDFHPFLTIEETLRLHGRLLGLDRRTIRSRSDELMSLLRLERERGTLRTLSKGTVRKAGLAAALLGEPELLLLDEPTSGIDPVVSRDVTDEIARRRDRGTTVLLSSHRLADVDRLCDRLVVLYRGRVVREGRVDELLAREGETSLTFRGLGPGAIERLRAAAEAQGAEWVGASTPHDELGRFFLRVLELDGRRDPERDR